MKPHRLPLTLVLLLAPHLANAQTAAPMLNPPAQRLSDEAISADQKAFETVQARIQRLNHGGRPLRDYHLAKAQCWLDVSFHEYTRNDRSAFPQGAMEQSLRLVQALEAKATPLPDDTPLVNDAARLRPDLWQRSAALATASGGHCAAAKRACAEVQLVHAGNEHNQQQWRHAKPYIQIAEDLLAEGEVLAAACVPVPAPPPARPPAPDVVAAAAALPAPQVARLPAPTPLPAPAALQRITTNLSVVFNFDRQGSADMRPASVAQLAELMQRIKAERLLVSTIRITGHADRLNGTGSANYNMQLARNRATTVRDHLANLGADKLLMSADARGDSQPVQACQGRFKSEADLQECLLPNRRVDVVVEAVKPAR